MHIPYGEFPDIVTLLTTRRSPITTECYIIYIKETIMKYLSSEYHNKCIIAYQKNIERIKQSDKTQLTNYISKSNSDLAYKIVSLLIMVYYYSRKLVLPTNSFPARVVNMMASKCKYNYDDNIITNTDLQYMTPHAYKEVVLIIIDTYM